MCLCVYVCVRACVKYLSVLLAFSSLMCTWYVHIRMYASNRQFNGSLNHSNPLFHSAININLNTRDCVK